MLARIGIIAALATTAAPAAGVGYYNMPTSLQQCLGVGFGPGYHAPLMLGPAMHAGIAAQPVQRIPAPLPPRPGCGFDAPSVWSDPAPCGGQASYDYSAAPMSLSVERGVAAPPMAPGPSFVDGAEAIAAPTPSQR